ncbi:unnamed protein product [Vitrella brassicaformis CCMP3155]|uniref:Uncharacterized protein n=1 Tax=Vitrella brassicaformis (strain CCMP3155) TaxID=1169540 RepID=A0A0G4H5C5_VITBC|nr:unnamed protein product [Vitrella brassicaformis CCMP3155]|eukprot:CEM38991.1 unnamed protein product [Vitrella brassicaformis CCMP3155]
MSPPDKAHVYGSHMWDPKCPDKQTCVVDEIRMASGPTDDDKRVDKGEGTCETVKTKEDEAKHCNSAGKMLVGSDGPETWCMAANVVKIVEMFQSRPGHVFKGADLMSTETDEDGNHTIKFFPGHDNWDKDRKTVRKAHLKIYSPLKRLPVQQRLPAGGSRYSWISGRPSGTHEAPGTTE